MFYNLLEQVAAVERKRVGAAEPQSHRVPERQSVGAESVRAAERRGGGVPERRSARTAGLRGGKPPSASERRSARAQGAGAVRCQSYKGHECLANMFYNLLEHVATFSIIF